MLLSADSPTIIFVKIYCYWTRTVGVIAKGSTGPVFLRQSVHHHISNMSLHYFSTCSIQYASKRKQLCMLEKNVKDTLSDYDISE